MINFKSIIRRNPFLTLIFLILPFVHFFTGVILHYQFGFFFMDVRDPEYFHLMSGAAIGQFKFNTGYIDHPGIPIQLIIAIASRFTFWLSGAENMAEDVVLNPEKYLFASNLLFNLVFSAVIFIVGKRALSITRNYWMAFLLQISFFGSVEMLRVLGRLTPDGFMLMPLGLICLLLLEYIYDEDALSRPKRYVLWFGVLTGLGLAIKLSFIAYIIIPFIIVKGLKNKIITGLYSLAFFFVFAFPVLSHLKRFWKWGSDMFMHSGKWGSGETNFMDLSQFNSRFNALINYDIFLFVLVLTILLLSVVLILKRRDSANDRKLSYVGLSTSLSVLFLMFLITKHFGLHYFVSAVIFKVFFLLIFFLLMGRLFKIEDRMLKVMYIPVLIATVLLGLSIVNVGDNVGNERRTDQMQRLNLFRQHVSNDDVIIISGYYLGAPFKSYALGGGFNLSGPARKLYKKYMRKHYGNHYMHYGWSDNYFNWTKFSNSKEIIQKDKPVFIFCGKTKHQDAKKILQKFRNENPTYQISLDTIIENTSRQEMLFRLHYDDDLNVQDVD